MIPRTKSFLSIFFFAIFLCGSVVARAGDAMPKDLLAVSSEQAVFVAHVEKSSDGSVHTDVMSRRLGGDVHWHTLITLGRRVVSLTAHGENAIALLDNGDWLTIWEDGSPSGPQPPEARLTALAADGSLDHYFLWALADVASPTTVPSTVPSTSSSTLPASMPSPVPGGPALYKFEGNHWMRAAALPAEVAGSSFSSAALSVVRSVPVLTISSSPNQLRSWTWNGTTWSAPVDVTASAPVHDFRIIEAGLPPTFWISSGGAGILNGPMSAGNERPLADDGMPPDAPRAAALAAETLRIYSASSDKIYEQAYNTDGSLMGKREEIVAEANLPDSPWQTWFAPGVTAAFAIIVLTAIRQTPPINPEVLESAGVALAPLWSRFFAGIIDAAPVLLSIAYAVYEASKFEAMGQTPPARLAIPFYITLLLYMVYTTTAELVRGQTLGKWLFGLRIVNQQGVAPDSGAMIMRNLLRLVDLMMMFIPLALIFFSPLRQRLGDVAAGTLVVKPISRSDLP